MVQPSSATVTARLDRLTSLRFVAALVVVLTHVSILVPQADVQRFAVRGAVGVSFFFMLSGFVLTWSHHPADRASWFWRRRAARIVPLHLVTYAGALAIVVGLAHRHPPTRAWLLSLGLLHAWSPNPRTYFAGNGVSWSLSVEAFFYAGFPLTLLLLRRMRASWRWPVAAVALSVVAVLPLAGHVASVRTTEWVVVFFPLTQLPQFVVGIVLALQMRDGWRPTALPGLQNAVLLVCLVALLFLPSPWWRVLPAVPASALLISRAVDSDVRLRAGRLQDPRLVRLGNWSFALYLCHALALDVLLVEGHPASYGVVEGVAAGLAVTVVSIGLAGLLHELIERPAERRLRGTAPRSELSATGAPKTA